MTDLEERVKLLEQGVRLPPHPFLGLPRPPQPSTDSPYWAWKKAQDERNARQIEAQQALDKENRWRREQSEAERVRCWEAHAHDRAWAEQQLIGANAQVARAREALHQAQERLRELAEVQTRFEPSRWEYPVALEPARQPSVSPTKGRGYDGVNPPVPDPHPVPPKETTLARLWARKAQRDAQRKAAEG